MTNSSAAPQRLVSDQEIKRRFSYHPPKGDQPERYAAITEACVELAFLIRDLTPAGREQSLALTALEDVRMRANQAIATNE